MRLELCINKRSDLCPVKFCRNPRSDKQHHGICSKCHMREWRAANPMRDAYNNLRASARKRRKRFDMTFAEFEEWCARTGYVELRGRMAHQFQADRINPRGGYTRDNLQMLTCSENTAKGNRERERERERETKPRNLFSQLTTQQP